jgi:hypothetical protein
MSKIEIIIGTTAINRPELHKDNMKEWHDWINSIDKTKYNINWFINVDYVEKLESSVEDTILNLKEILQDIPTHFITSSENNGNFLKACKQISSNINEFIDDNDFDENKIIIIWLEDDWKLNNINIPLQEIIELYLGNLTYINLSFIRSNYIHALAPSIINWNLWKQIHLEAWLNQDKHIDPEHCVGLYYINNFGKYQNIQNITVINKSIKKDYFSQDFLCKDKSYYTYHNEKYNIFKNKKKYITKDKIKDFCANTITFIRISPSFCIDGVNYGRMFMEKNNLKKIGVQNDSQIEFYS